MKKLLLIILCSLLLFSCAPAGDQGQSQAQSDEISEAVNEALAFNHASGNFDANTSSTARDIGTTKFSEMMKDIFNNDELMEDNTEVIMPSTKTTKTSNIDTGKYGLSYGTLSIGIQNAFVDIFTSSFTADKAVIRFQDGNATIRLEESDVVIEFGENSYRAEATISLSDSREFNGTLVSFKVTEKYSNGTYDIELSDLFYKGEAVEDTSMIEVGVSSLIGISEG